MKKKILAFLLTGVLIFSMSGGEILAAEAGNDVLKVQETRVYNAAPKYSYSPSYCSLAYSSVGGVSTSTILAKAKSIIENNEGGYGSVNPNDNGALSLGKMQWHAYRAADLVKTIISKDNETAYNLLGSALYTEFTKSYADYSSYQAAWKTRTLNSTESAAINKLLTTEASKQVQDQLEQSDLSQYLNHGIALGITSPAALVYFADVENQWGSGGVESNLKYARRIAGSNNVSLNDLHIGCLCYSSSYDPRRWNTFKYASELGWSNCKSGDYRIMYRYNSSDTEGIKWLQKALNAYFKTNMTVNGSYNADTKAAVTKYQTAAGLVVDGYAGTATVGSLIRSMYKSMARGTSTGITTFNGTVTPAPVVTLKTATITVSKTSYSLNSNASAFSLGAKSNHSESALAFSSSNTSVATVDTAGKVTIKGAGTAKITISQPESKNYESASKTVTITVANAKPSAYTVPTTTLGSGRSMSKNDVKWFQACMVQLGYYSNLVDGSWDSALTTAAKNFQKAAGLTADGLIGPASRTVLQDLMAVKEKVMTVTVTAGENKATLKWAKQSKATGYYIYRKASTESSYTKIKTITSNATVSYTDTKAVGGTAYYYRVRAYEKKGSISVTSSYKTASKVTIKKPAGTTTTTTTTYAVPTVTLGSGRSMSKNDVKWFQDAMVKLGYYSDTVDGTWDSGLTSAAKKFQAAAGLAADGLIGPASRTVIVDLITIKNKKMTATVTAGDNQATVKWSAQSKATGYYVYRKAVGASSWTKIKSISSGTTTSYKDTAANGGTSYYYAVRAYRKTGSVTATSSYTATSKITIKGYSKDPASYTVPTATLGSGRSMSKSNVQWLQASLVQLKYYSDPCDGVWDSALTTAVKNFQSATKLDVDGLVGSGTRGEIQKLLAVKGASMSCTVTGQAGKITINWVKNSNSTAYYVYRKESGGSYSKIKTISSGSTVSYSDTSAKAGTTYYYYVKAVRKTGSVSVASGYKASSAVKRKS